MKLNGTEVTLQQVNTEQVDGVFIIHDSVSNKVIMFNETSSFVWKIILEHVKNGSDLDTFHIVQEILKTYDMPRNRKQEVWHDVEGILQDFFASGLLKAEFPDQAKISDQ